jgi:hypothetical protein
MALSPSSMEQAKASLTQLLGHEPDLAEVRAILGLSMSRPTVSKPKPTRKLAVPGVNASPGTATGLLALDADTAEKWTHDGKLSICTRQCTTRLRQNCTTSLQPKCSTYLRPKCTTPCCGEFLS